MKIKICELCGKEFTPTGRNASRRKYCDGPHYMICEVCGKKFEITDLSSGSIPKTCSKECANKLRIQNMHQTLKDKYGHENPSQIPQFSCKAQESRDKVISQTVAKAKATNLHKYGVEVPIQNEEIRKKIEQTNIERYGVANPSQNVHIQQLISDKLKSKEVREKYKETSLLHYGVEYPMQSDIVKHQMVQNSLDKYGVKYPTQRPEVKAKLRELYYKIREDSDVIERSKLSTHTTCLQKYGVNWPCELPQCRNASYVTISKYNRAFGKMLEDINLKFTYEFRIEDKSYDFHILNTDILIELNPTYTHNTVGNHWGNGVSISYHYDKYKLAKDAGYRCIQVWDWDDIGKVLSLLSPKTTIYARKCKLQGIDKKTVKAFEDTYHLQNNCKGQIVCYGLYYENELVEIMTFGKPRYNNNYEWELLRLCTDSKYYVVGGAQKLFKHFIRIYNPNSIISYCDLSKFTGEVYERLGFALHHISPPNKVWSKGSKKITNNLLLQRGYDQLFYTNYGKGTSNEELMLKDGWLPVYDCGQAAYIYHK